MFEFPARQALLKLTAVSAYCFYYYRAFFKASIYSDNMFQKGKVPDGGQITESANKG